MEPSLKFEEDLLPIPTSSSTPKPSPKKLGFFQSLVKGPGFLGLYIHPVLLFLIGGSILLYGQRSSISSYFSNHVNGYLSTTAPLPPTSISWGPCPDRPANETRFSCGFVEVPLDHAKGYAGGSAHVALSKFSVEKGVKKRGTVFVNPGGPGGSGYGYTFRAGPSFGVILNGQYDIVGFDPRGISLTSPQMRCFKTMREETIFLNSLPKGIEPLGDEEQYRRGVAQEDARNLLMAERCEREAGAGAGRHMGTGTVVRDIELLSTIIEGKDAPINFAGWSYGTVVAEYLIGIFPDRIGHVVADGVCDPLNWVDNPQHKWGRSDFYDSERTYEAFLSSCADAGPERCPLATSKSHTPKSMAQDVDDLLDRLLEYPLIVREEGSVGGFLTPNDVKSWMFSQLYRPTGWTDFASGLRETLDGDGTRIYKAQKVNVELDETKPGSTSFANPGVECSDSPSYPSDLTSKQVVDMIVKENLWQVKHTSKHFAGLGATTCPRWTSMREPERFKGPFNATLSNDILIIGNTADPITSIKHARLLNKIQPQSRLIHHDGFGHCSTAMASLCTTKAIRAYFLDDVLPENELLCKPDVQLFPGSSNATASILSTEDRELLQAIETLGTVLAENGFRGTARRF